MKPRHDHLYENPATNSKNGRRLEWLRRRGNSIIGGATERHMNAQELAWRLMLAGMLLGLANQPAMAQPLPVQPRDHVVDLANVVREDAERELIRYLLELEQKTGAQMIVLTVNSTGGVPIEEFAHRTAERWQLGQRGKDNGVLMVVAVHDGKFRIEVGYGLEHVLPDGLCGRVLRDIMAPHFRRGDYTGGIREATLILANRVANASGATISGLPARDLPAATESGSVGPSVCPACVVLLLLFMVFASVSYTHLTLPTIYSV